MNQSFWHTLRDEVKSSISCIDYLNRYTHHHITRDNTSICAPSFIRPGSDSHSFGVWDDSCFDFVTNTSYDVIDLCALHQFNGDTTAALEFLAGRKIPRKSDSDPSSSHFSGQLQKLQDRVNYWHSQLLESPQAITYLAKRNISIDTAKSLKLGFSPNTNRLIIPYFSNHGFKHAVYFTARDISGSSQLRYKFPSNNDKDFGEILDHIPYGIHTARPGFFEHDTAHDSETGQLVKLDSHNIRYDYLCIAEGIFDIISFIQDGWACMSGKKNSAHLQEFLSVCRQYRDCGQKIFLCYDSDDAGQKFQRDMANILLKNRIPFFCGKLPKTFTVSRPDHPDHGQEIHIKDISDFYSAGGSLEDLVRNAQRGVEYLAEFCKSEEDLQQLFTDTGKAYHKDRMQLVHLRDKAFRIADLTTETIVNKKGETVTVQTPKRRFNPLSVRELFNQASKGLMDSDVAHMVLDRHNLKYDLTGDFYEYSGGVWKTVHANIVERYITDVMGEHINASKMQSVRRFMQSYLAGSYAFNTQPVFVFENGTLWLDEPFETVSTQVVREHVLDEKGEPIYRKTAGACVVPEMYDREETVRTPIPNKEIPGMPANFHKHSPDDMCTYKVSYAYVPDAYSEELEKALDLWFDHDETKKRLARQMAGYVLYATCCLQKFFYLIGDGANGKSTFMHVIEAIFGHDHGTSLSVKQMASGFDGILLKNSLYNMSFDSAADINGCEELIKAVSAGDPIVAAHKGVDAERFRTRSKLFIAANKHFSANDVSRGLLRRIVFLGFNKIFRQGEADPYVEDRLLADLPALFNWAYKGYLDLKASGHFCETDEQQTLMEEFKEQLSGTLCFYRDSFMYWNEYKVADEYRVYDLYKDWAKNNGEVILSRRKFIAELRQVLRVEDSQITAVRNGRTKLWEFIFPERDRLILDDDPDDAEHISLQEQEQEQEETQPQTSGSVGALPEEIQQVAQPEPEHTQPASTQADTQPQAKTQAQAAAQPQAQAKTETELQGSIEDIEYDETTQALKYKYKGVGSIPHDIIKTLCLNPAESPMYAYMRMNLKFDDDQIVHAACKTLAIDIVFDMVKYSKTPIYWPYMADDFLKEGDNPKKYSKQKMNAAIDQMMTNPNMNWLEVIENQHTTNEDRAKYLATTVQVALMLDPIKVRALIQNENIHTIRRTLRQGIKDGTIITTNRPVHRHYLKGWNDNNTRTFYLACRDAGNRWSDQMLFWAAAQPDPIAVYNGALDAIATYCLKHNRQNGLAGLSDMFSFDNVID